MKRLIKQLINYLFNSHKPKVAEKGRVAKPFFIKYKKTDYHLRRKL